MPLEKLAEIIEQDKKTTRGILANMQYKFDMARGIMLRELDGSWQFAPSWVGSLYFETGSSQKKAGLTPAAYETLSIIAYNQPVTRAYIEQIRGVNSDSVLMTLMERNLIREAGRDDAPGRPKLYETTEEFLRVFGFSSLKDLPPLEMNEIPEVIENMPVD